MPLSNQSLGFKDHFICLSPLICVVCRLEDVVGWLSFLRVMITRATYDNHCWLQIYDPNDHSFTFRAAILGAICGSLIAISNMYLGLKTGMYCNGSHARLL